MGIIRLNFYFYGGINNMFDLAGFVSGYGTVLHYVAEVTVHTLEMVGILIIIIGSAKAIIQISKKLFKKQSENVMVTLGRALALALEFKMGAEIVNTVVIRELKELGILAIVIALRAVLAVLIHWEIKNEKKEEAEQEKTDKQEK